MTFWICATCAVESAEQPDVCAICADERQWVPASGQRWTTLEELRAQGYRAQLEELEPDLYAITSSPGAGIGQQSKLLVTAGGQPAVGPDRVPRRRRGRAHPRPRPGPRRSRPATRTCTASRWSGAARWATRGARRRGRRPLDQPSRPRDPDVVRRARGAAGRDPVAAGRPLPRQRDRALAAGAAVEGVLLSGDTIFANPDRSRVAFMRSYPNHLPLSGAVARRVADHVDGWSSTASTATSPTSSRPTPRRSSAARPSATSAGSTATSTTSPEQLLQPVDERRLRGHDEPPRLVRREPVRPGPARAPASSAPTSAATRSRPGCSRSRTRRGPPPAPRR